MYKKISKYQFKNKNIEEEFPNKKEYYYLGFQSIDCYITKIVYRYLSVYNSSISFCCSFELIQKLIKRILTKEYFNKIFKTEEKYIYSFIGAVISDTNEEEVIEVINEIYKVENFLLTIYKKEENKYSYINEWVKKNEYELQTSYSYSSTITCTCNINNMYFTNEDKTMLEAKYKVCEEIATYLEENKLYYKISELITNVTIEDAISKLEYLYDKGYINKPNYIYIDHDDYEETKYEVRCSVEGLSFYSVKIHNTKEKAKELSAYSMLQMIKETS